MIHAGPFRMEIIEGEPVDVFDRQLTPLARVVSGIRRRGTIRAEGVEGKALAAAYVQPLAVIERHGNVKRTLPIQDSTAKVIGRMALVALALPVVAAVLIVVLRPSRPRQLSIQEA